jgi:RsiW-degrading membrane proteinase PrsW (M82 family)
MLVYAAFVYSLNRFEKEPKLLMAATFLWGAIVAAGIAFTINSYIGTSVYRATGSSNASQVTTGALVAPVVEESLKGIAILLVMAFFSHRFNSFLDGMVYAGVVALGFAATENIYYIYNYGYVESGFHGVLYLAFVRVIVVGWQHPFFTAFTGIGVSIARLTRSLSIRLVSPVLGWISAVLIHSLHNTLANVLSGNHWSIIGTVLDWTGWILMAALIVWAIVREQAWVKHQLAGEVAAGILTPSQYRIASSPVGHTIACLAAISTGRYAATSRFYQACGMLAHTKQLVEVFGETGPSLDRIHSLRVELLALSPQAVRGDEPVEISG